MAAGEVGALKSRGMEIEGGGLGAHMAFMICHIYIILGVTRSHKVVKKLNEQR